MNWNAARIHFLALIILALYKVRTVNLAEIAQALSGSVAVESKYRRIQRFLSNFAIPAGDIAHCIGGWLPRGSWILSLDRTTWRFGETVINLLVLGVVYQGTAIPVLWLPLPKKGNSDTQERQVLISRFLHLFGLKRLQYLTADREFIGEQWLEWLLEQGINPYLRIKKNTLIRYKDNKPVPVQSKFAHLPTGTKRCLRNVQVWGCTVHIEGMRLKSGEYLIVLSDKPVGIIKAYKQRWNIETMFGNLKSRGFRFEQTHLKDPTRISKLLALLALAFCYALQVGVWRITQGMDIVFKKTLNRPLKTVFRHGLDYLRTLLLNSMENLLELVPLPRFLSCT